MLQTFYPLNISFENDNYMLQMLLHEYQNVMCQK